MLLCSNESIIFARFEQCLFRWRIDSWNYFPGVSQVNEEKIMTGDTMMTSHNKSTPESVSWSFQMMTESTEDDMWRKIREMVEIEMWGKVSIIHTMQHKSTLLKLDMINYYYCLLMMMIRLTIDEMIKNQRKSVVYQVLRAIESSWCTLLLLLLSSSALKLLKTTKKCWNTFHSFVCFTHSMLHYHQ